MGGADWRKVTFEKNMPEVKPFRSLSAPDAKNSVAAIPEYTMPSPAWEREQGETEEPVIELSQYLWILRRHKWRIIAFVLICVGSTILVSARLTPIYEATASIDIDRQAPAGVIGHCDAARMAPNDADQFLATQIKAIQADSVVQGRWPSGITLSSQRKDRCCCRLRAFRTHRWC